VPVIGVFSSYLILDERVGASDVVALLLVLSALVLVLLIPAWNSSRRLRAS
ncbi:MAG: EamA family transporter, partial [Gammaproteobacteria bacterium]|nr:EamA family transporter [Gammaproteobacteria bacterium]